MADNHFEHPRLAAIYDTLDGDRCDLEVYADIAHQLGARQILDVGCGTGTFALVLAERGLGMIGVDPAAGFARRGPSEAGRRSRAMDPR